MILRTLSSTAGKSEVTIEEMHDPQGIKGLLVWVETPRGMMYLTLAKKAALVLGKALLEEGEKLP